MHNNDINQYFFFYGVEMRNNLKLIIASIAMISIALVSCQQKEESPIMKDVFNSNNIGELVEKIKADDKISKEDLDYLTAGINRNINTLDSINGKTVGDIINLQKEMLMKSSINALTNTAIGASVASRYMGWEPDTTNPTAISGYKIYARNKGEKNIKRLFGRLNFFTNQKQVLGLFDVNLTVEIPAGKETIILAKIAAGNQENGVNNVALIRKTLEEAPNTLFAQWQVLEVEYEDGSSIALTEKKKEEAAN